MGVFSSLSVRAERYQALGNTKFRAPRTRVLLLFCWGREQGMCCDDTYPCPVLADAERRLRRTNTIARLGLEEAFDDAILQGMEADDGEPPAGRQQVQRLRQHLLQMLEFVIDGDAQCLEGAGGRVYPAWMAGHPRSRNLR